MAGRWQVPGVGHQPGMDNVLRAKQLLDDCVRFHCLPSEMDDEDYHVMELLRSIAAAEKRYQDQDRKSRRR